MRYEELFEQYDRSDAYDETPIHQDPEIIQAAEEFFVSIGDMFDQMDVPEEIEPTLDKFFRIYQQKGQNVEDVYIDRDTMPKVTRALQSGKAKQAFRWLLNNGRTMQELADNGELDDIVSELGSARQEANDDPYASRGLSRRDFIK